MPFINTIDINGEIYNLGNLSDGYHIVDLPKSLKRNDIFILQGDVVDSLNDTLEDMPHNKPLSAYQGKTLDEKISAESQSSTDRADTITQNLNDEISRSTNKDNDLDTKIDTEIQRASDTENTLATNINAEITRAKDAEKVITNNLNAETTRATKAENTLTTNLNSEISRATQAESNLNTAITNENNRANTAENALKSAINTEKSRIDAFLAAADTGDKAIDTLKEIQNYIDTDGKAAAEMTANIGKNATDIKALQDSVGAGGSSSTGLFKAIADAESSAKSYADDNFIKQTSIAYDLSTDSREKVLSAEQGKILNETKVDKLVGKGLSTNDYTTAEKNKLATIAEGANKYVHPVYNKQQSGLYKIAVDSTGHVSGVWPVSKDDIVALDIPAQDTVYELPQASATEIGGVKIDSDYTTGSNDVAASTSALKTVYESLLARIEALEAQNSDTTT